MKLEIKFNQIKSVGALALILSLLIPFNFVQAFAGIGDTVFVIGEPDPASTVLRTGSQVLTADSTLTSAVDQVVINTPATLSQSLATGLVGTGAAVAGGMQGVLTGCEKVNDIAKLLGAADQFSGFGLIGVNPTEAVTLQSKIVAIETAIQCIQNGVLIPAKASAGTISSNLGGQQIVSQASNTVAQLQVVQDQLRGRLKMTTERIMKAIIVQAITPYIMQMAGNFVNKIQSKLVDPSVLSTALTLKNYVYSIEYIKSHYKDGVDQSIIYDLVRNGGVPGVVLPMVRARAVENLQNCQDGSLSLEDSIVCMGIPSNQPHTLQAMYADQAQKVDGHATQAAAVQIQRDQGNLASRQCDEGSYQKYLTNQASFKTANNSAAEAFDAYAFLEENGASEDELNTAWAEYNAANTKAQALVKNQGNEYLSLFCSGITNSGATALLWTQKAMGNALDGINQLQKDNLTGVAGIAKVVLGQVFGKLLGMNNTSAKQLTDYALNAGLGTVINSLPKNNTTGTIYKNSTTPSGIMIDYYKSSSVSRDPSFVNYEITFNAEPVGKGKSIVINGPPAVKFSNGNSRITINDLSGEETVAIPAEWETASFSLELKEGENGTGTTVSFEAKTVKVDASTVSGATTINNDINVRGSSFSVR